MLSEQQIEHLLEICEAKVGAPLKGLRERLLRHEHTVSVIWELVVVHTLFGRFATVEPEAGPGMPDAIVRGSKRRFFRNLSPARPVLSVEAAVVTSPSDAECNRCSEFTDWLYGQVEKLGVAMSGASIDVTAQAKAVEARIPERQRWRQMLADPSWKRFASQLRSRGEAVWNCPEGNVAVRFKAKPSDSKRKGILTSRRLTPRLPDDITKHPVYREIRKKARQAKDWPSDLTGEPVLLAICVSGSSSEFSRFQGVNDHSIQRAVWSALLDHDRLGDLERVNVLRQRLMVDTEKGQLVVESKRLRVAGSGLISAVLVVRMEQHMEPGHGVKSVAKPELFVNRHARNPLPAELQSEIQRLNFNAIVYGPGRESWENTSRGSLTARNARRGGSLHMKLWGNGDIEVRIPTIQILKILSGEETAQKVFAGYGSDAPQPLDIFRKAFASELTLKSVEVIDPDPASREEQRIAFRFVKGKSPVVARAREKKR